MAVTALSWNERCSLLRTRGIGGRRIISSGVRALGDEFARAAIDAAAASDPDDVACGVVDVHEPAAATICWWIEETTGLSAGSRLELVLGVMLLEEFGET